MSWIKIPVRRRLVVAIALSASPMLAVAVGQVGQTRWTAEAASGLTHQAVYSLAVSPAYKRTGLVVAMAADLTSGCKSNCLALWVTHDGGATWSQAPAKGWIQGARPIIAVDQSGHETLFAGSSNAFQRSDDDGGSWTNLASPGLPAVDPMSADDAVAVAGARDYLLRGTSPSTLAGSGGAYRDIEFMYSPTFPASGNYAPVLLSALDAKTGNAVVERCNLSFACSGATELPSGGPWAGPVMLYPASDFAQQGTVFGQTNQGIFKSTNGGQTFLPLQVVTTPGATTPSTAALALSPGYSEDGPSHTVYVTIFQILGTGADQHGSGGVFASTNGGATWSRLGSPSVLDDGAMSVAAAPDGRLFAGYLSGTGGGHAGLLCSTDGGKTWQYTCPATPARRAGSGSQDHSGTAVTPCPGACPAGGATAPAAGQSEGTSLGSAAAGVADAGHAVRSTATMFTPRTALAVLAAVVAAALLGLAGYRRWRSSADST